MAPSIALFVLAACGASRPEPAASPSAPAGDGALPVAEPALDAVAPEPAAETAAPEAPGAAATCVAPVESSPPEHVEVTLDLDARSYRRDQSVGMTLHTKNLQNHEVHNPRSSPQKAIFWIASGDRVIWRSDVGEAAVGGAAEDVFRAGETKTETLFWTGKRCNAAGDALERGSLDPGAYVAHGAWRSGSGVWTSAAVPFRVR
jgi:hypothetical protein